MKRGFIGCVSVALAVAVLTCAQSAAGEMPSQSGASTAAAQPKIQTDGGGLTAQQSLALATVAPGGEEAYGSTSETAEMILLYAAIVAGVVLIGFALASSGL
jgi:hypothetical protein